jgi:hypothetical protein
VSRGTLRVGWSLPSVAAALGLFLSGAGAVADDALVGWDQGMSDGELARQAGLGVVDHGPDVSGHGNTVVSGTGNATSVANVTAEIHGDISAEVVKGGDIRHVATGPAKGFNVFQLNTAPNVNQIANQSIVVNIINHADTSPR